MRILNFVAFFFALTSALFLYALNYETRRLEAEVQQSQREAERARSDIAVLKADRSFLSRPERIEPIAREQGLGPASAQQFINAAQLRHQIDGFRNQAAK